MIINVFNKWINPNHIHALLTGDPEEQYPEVAAVNSEQKEIATWDGFTISAIADEINAQIQGVELELYQMKLELDARYKNV
jgi:hypothetical protein